MKEALFLLTIGPVQSFIAQSRKTQDLYVSSFLLSHLCRITAQKAKEDYSAQIIFPDLSCASLPNRFIARVEYIDQVSIHKIGEDLKDYAQNQFKEIAQFILNKLKLKSSCATELQLDNFIQIHWVASPYVNEEYACAYKKLERYLGAIKNVRQFQQVEEAGRKCFLSGEHNVLYYRGEPKAYLDKQAQMVSSMVPLRYIADNEGLSAIALVKRCAGEYFIDFCNYNNYQQDFPSTAEIALMESINRLDKKLLYDYQELFLPYTGDFNYQLFYEENITEKYFKENKIPLSFMKEALDYVEKIKLNANEKKVRLSKYYAVIMLDGDSMGKWLSGDYLVDIGNIRAFHTNLTGVLGEYAQKAGEIVSDKRGRLIYAGGDDVLALVNVNHLISVLEELRTAFPDFARLSNVKTDVSSTVSASVCIAHYKTPLAEVLQWARRMEKEAKNIDGKNAVAFAVLKHSGEIHKGVCKWDYEGKRTMDALKYMVDSLSRGRFSNNFIKSLSQEFRCLMNINGKYAYDLLVEAEMKRLLSRSCMMPSDTKEEIALREAAIMQMFKYIYEFYVQMPFVNMLNLLYIADFISREVN